MKYFIIVIPCFLMLLNFSYSQTGPRTSDFQSGDRPLGLDIVAPVMAAGSDTASANFQVTELPQFLSYVNLNWNTASNLIGLDAVSLDPSAIVVQQDTIARAYLLRDGAGYRNTLGFNTVDMGTNASSVSQLLFPDVSSNNQYFADPESLASDPRSSGNPLLVGDFVDLGAIGNNQTVNFFLIANGANGGTNLYDSDIGTNPDGVRHLVTYAIPDSPFLLVGFEDLWGGGDADFNDVMFAINVGASNVHYLANPEPSFLLMMGAVIGLGFWLYRRHDWQYSL